MIKLLISFSLIFIPLIASSGDISGCQIFTEKYNKIYNLPNKLLTSISLVESGIAEGKKLTLGHGHLMLMANQNILIIKEIL